MAHAGGRPVGSKTVISKVNYIFTNKANKLIQYKVVFSGGRYHVETINCGISGPSRRVTIRELCYTLEKNCGENFIKIFIKIFGINRAVEYYFKHKEEIQNG